MLNVTLLEKLPQIQDLLINHKVKRAYAFGSVTGELFNAESDIDLLIAFEDNLDPVEYGDHYFSLAEQLEQLLQRDVDLLTEKSLRNPYLIRKINRTKVLLYE